MYKGEIIKDTNTIMAMLREDRWFMDPGAYVMVDGQFGSTGKGILASLLGCVGADMIEIITTNAGPNSGHTGSMFTEDSTFMTQQLPCSAIAMRDYSPLMASPIIYLNGGSIIDPHKLGEELSKFQIDEDRFFVHPCAAVISSDDIEEDYKTLRAIASTGKGTGPALSKKLSRIHPKAVAKQTLATKFEWVRELKFNPNEHIIFVETSQGFSLGVNSEQFYPNTTSRECTVMQAISDARIPAQSVRKVAMSFRTYPIRVGDTENSSGGWYYDQYEIGFDEIGVAPEYTSVTKRQRRIATWSWQQFYDAIDANQPDLIFLNFMNYLPDSVSSFNFVNTIKDRAHERTNKDVKMLLGYGPYIKNIEMVI